ncbi:heavy-metal-associated domain-containing protein [Ferruginibacter sp. SUN106]|uniref:heavy-metal-associated domain-containing protein n=1 Tax=Ferruginibacter sp. SUN106 TaxID=2978348 RepID=UPI003D365194
MKKLFLGIATSFLFLAGNAQIKTSDKAVISLPTLQNCDKCKDQIEFFISKSEGVTAIKVDLKRKTATVSWLTDRTNKEYIKTAIANLGFDADDIEAEEFAYKRLPACCKKPAEAPKPGNPKG